MEDSLQIIKPKDSGSEPKAITVSDLRRGRTPGFVSVYANNVGSAMTPYDLRLIFGQIVFGPDEEPHIEDSVSITMAWEHVLPLRDLLTRVTEKFEHDYGPIRVKFPQASTEPQHNT